MRYEKNQIVYEVGDWVTIDNLVGQLEGEIGATFPIKQLAGVYYYGDWDRVNKITGDCWEGRNLRPATQEEINKATEEEKIMWGQYEVEFDYLGGFVIADAIKIGCVTVSKELWNKTAKKAGWK